MITPHPQQGWSERLARIRSAGSTAKRPGSLAGLAAARAAHKGQFFTSTALARLVWAIGVEQSTMGLPPARKIHILDNSIGSGRLVQFAEPATHSIAGLDVDADSALAVAEAAQAAGIACDVLAAGMEEVRPSGFDIALINPPFSLQLTSPAMAPYSCTTWGPYGAHTAAPSHAYALHQALDAAAVVVAIVPAGYAREVFGHPTVEMEGRLRAWIELPRGLFAEEGTDVAVSLLVFGPQVERRQPERVKLPALDAPVPDFGLFLGPPQLPAPLSRLHNPGVPTIPGQVTGDRRVRVVHSGRRVGLKISCALTYAKVWNAILVGPVCPIEGHRYPKGVKYQGQGRLDVEVMLLQSDPMAAFEELLDSIRDAGGEPDVDPGLRGYLRRRIRRHARESSAFGHCVKGGVPGASDKGTLRAWARRKELLDPLKWGSPLLEAGQEIELEPDGAGSYITCVAGQKTVLREDQVASRFELLTPRDDDGWYQAHPSRCERFAPLAATIRAQLAACGALDVAGWDYQANDLVEVLMGRHALVTWRPGCGKGRAALALCMAGGRRNLVVVESHLVEELVQQAHEAGIDPALWQVITRPEHLEQLRQINIISYERLRRPLYERRIVEPAGTGDDDRPAKIVRLTSGRRTYASVLRRRISRVVADEAHLLRHLETQQTAALWKLSAKRRFGMTGTPMANYVQNLLPLTQWVYGDGTAIQPFGRHRPFLRPQMWKTMSAAERGVDAFAERHVVTEWVTRAWEEGLEVGAKRQVPRINNITLLRDWAAPLLKRRHEDEPEVARYFQVPQPTTEVVEVDWDPRHLAHYLAVADEFTTWYQQASREARERGNNVNLAMLLARIGAVVKACNVPQHRSEARVKVAPYLELTSKQRYAIDRLVQWTQEGHKTVCYTDSPLAVEMYVNQLAARGVEAVPFHGKLPIKRRTRDMNQRFRYGDAPVLVASLQTIQNGLNIWQADRGLFTVRSWTHTMEEQAMRRLLRPQQARPVHFEFVQLAGSIDCYQAQLTRMKGESAAAAIDFLTPETDDQEFVHLDMILDRFVGALAEGAGINPHVYREALRAA